MDLRRFGDPGVFLAAVGPFLEAREADHNLLLGIAGDLAAGRRFGDDAPYLVQAVHEGRTVSVAIRTPPHNLVLSHTDDLRAVDALARDVLERSRPPGLLAPVSVGEAFIATWHALTGEHASITVRERIYRLQTVRLGGIVRGAARPITEEDRPTVTSWLRAFSEEALDEPDNEAERNFERRLAGPAERTGMWLWEVDERTVSITGYGSPTPHGIRVGPVYTPPRERREGYASALVAAVSQSLLDAGRDFVFLFTDLSNATSNHIYAEIGYQSVTDVNQYNFTSG